MKTFTKKYQLWTTTDGATYSFVEFDTLQECITAPKSDPWYITKGVSLVVQEAGESIGVPIYQPQPLSLITYATNTDKAPGLEDEDPEAAARAAAYAGGPVGKIT